MYWLVVVPWVEVRVTVDVMVTVWPIGYTVTVAVPAMQLVDVMVAGARISVCV